jgi:hypothetical protein
MKTHSVGSFAKQISSMRLGLAGAMILLALVSATPTAAHADIIQDLTFTYAVTNCTTWTRSPAAPMQGAMEPRPADMQTLPTPLIRHGAIALLQARPPRGTTSTITMTCPTFMYQPE